MMNSKWSGESRLSRRVGQFMTNSGLVKTPTFMPVGTYGSIKGVPMGLVESCEIDVVLANTYHLHLRPGEKEVASLGGLHKFMNTSKSILTDSGGFQVYSLAHKRTITEEGVRFSDPKTGNEIMLTPEKSIQIQHQLGADIIMAFDDLTGLSSDEVTRTKEAFERTHRWLDRSIAQHKRLLQANPKSPLLFGIVQGGLDENLRLKSLEIVQSKEVDGIAVGGLSVGEPKEDMYRILDILSPAYDPSRPHYLMGVGDPPDLRYAYSRNIDMADCVLPSRNGRHGVVWVNGDKKLNLKNLSNQNNPDVIQPGCGCYACSSGYSRGWLRHQFKIGDPVAGTLASLHNIFYLQQIAKEHRNTD